jgi:hypothetical protein
VRRKFDYLEAGVTEVPAVPRETAESIVVRGVHVTVRVCAINGFQGDTFAMDAVRWTELVR